MQNKFLCTALSLSGSFAHQSPPEGVGVALEVGLAVVGSHRVLLGEVHEVTGEYEAEEADVQRRDQLLKSRVKSIAYNTIKFSSTSPALRGLHI